VALDTYGVPGFIAVLAGLVATSSISASLLKEYALEESSLEEKPKK